MNKAEFNVTFAPPTRAGLAVAGLGLVGLPLAVQAAEGWRDAVPSAGPVPRSTGLIAGPPLSPVPPFPVNWGPGG